MHVTNRTILRKGPQRSPLLYTENKTDTRTHDASPSSWRLKAAINAMYDTTALSWKQLNRMSLDFYDQPSTFFFLLKLVKIWILQATVYKWDTRLILNNVITIQLFIGYHNQYFLFQKQRYSTRKLIQTFSKTSQSNRSWETIQYNLKRFN